MAYNFSFDWKAGFLPDPNRKVPVGYLVWFNGLNMGEFLKQDINVVTPYPYDAPSYTGVPFGPTTHNVTCVGVLDSFSWEGGVTDPLCISAYIAAENAEALLGKLSRPLENRDITKLGWWVIDFDPEGKIWYEESHPGNAVSVAGQLHAPGGNPRIQVASTATQVAPGVDVNVYNVYFEVVPPPNQASFLHFASSSKTPYLKQWGIVQRTSGVPDRRGHQGQPGPPQYES